MKKIINRRSRVMDALKVDKCSEQTENPEQLKKKLEEMASFTKMLPHTSEFLQWKLIEMRMNILENWECTKKKAVERLSTEVGELEEFQHFIENYENKKDDSPIEISDSISTKLNSVKVKNALKNVLKRKRSTSVAAPAPATPATSATAIKKQIQIVNSTPKFAQQPKKKKQPKILEEIKNPTIDDNTPITIGPNGTTITKRALISINWSLSGPAITRKLLMEVFDRDTLAFHTLTGKPSPAFMDVVKPKKKPLDAAKVADIIHIMTTDFEMTAKNVRAAITTKCADENKMYRQRKKRAGL